MATPENRATRSPLDALAKSVDAQRRLRETMRGAGDAAKQEQRDERAIPKGESSEPS